MILKVYALFRNLARLRQREDLVTTAIGQNRSVPIHEPMQSAEMFDHVEPWPNKQVVGVSKNDLRIQFAQLAPADCFDRALRADRHERRGVDHAMRGCELPAPRFCM